MANCTVTLNVAAKPGKYCEKLLMDFCGRLVKNKIIKHVPEFSTGKKGNQWYLLISCRRSEMALWSGIALGMGLAKELYNTQLYNDFTDAKDDFNNLGEISFASDCHNVDMSE
jgi:hypothetical protein